MAIKNFKFEQVNCDCGCGNSMNKFDNRNRIRKVINGHQYKSFWLGKKRPGIIEKMRKINTGKKLTKEHIRKCLLRRGMSGLEKKVNNIIQKYKFPYAFVGDGKFFIERKNPDFINTNGKKIAVEVFYKRHKDQFRGGCEVWMKERVDIFSKYGWKILFLDGAGLTNEKIVKTLDN
jgi:hypothetical protein